MLSNPLVSIVIPVYNGGDYLREAIDSALAQTYQPIEILVINDGSNDGGATRAIAESYGDAIRYLEKENGGVSSALNLGIQKMHGEYFSWLSHDDAYCPQKIEAQIRALPEETTRAVVYCNFATMNSCSEPMADTKASSRLHTSLTAKEALHHVLRHGTLNGCGFLIPRALLDECGFFDETLRYAQDALMWYRLFLSGVDVIVVPDALVKSRVHENQQTQKNRAKFSYDNQVICDQILPGLDAISTPEDDFVSEYAVRSAIKGEETIVRRCVQVLREKGRFSAAMRVRLGVMRVYGKLRPTIRAAYYQLFRGMWTGK